MPKIITKLVCPVGLTAKKYRPQIRNKSLEFSQILNWWFLSRNIAGRKNLKKVLTNF